MMTTDALICALYLAAWFGPLALITGILESTIWKDKE